MDVFFLDTEFTNGNFYLGDIFEIGLVSERSGNGFHAFIKPPYRLDHYIKFLCQITDRFLQKEGSSFKKTYDDMINFINSEVAGRRSPSTTIIIAAHGGFSSDFALLVTNCLKYQCNIGAMADYKFIDTVQILQKERESNNYYIEDSLSLQCLAIKVLGEPPGRLHSAFHDATTLKNIYQETAHKNILSQNITNNINTHTLESLRTHVTSKMPLTIEEICKMKYSVSSPQRLSLLLTQHMRNKTALKKKTVNKISSYYYYLPPQYCTYEYYLPPQYCLISSYSII